MKPIFIVNSLSATVAKKGARLAGYSAHASTVFEQDIFNQLDAIVEQGTQAGWVIIEGGDGTAHGIISAFFNRISDHNQMPKFTLLPGGMTNQVAKNVGLKRLSTKSLSLLFAGNHAVSKTPILKVSSQGHADKYGFLLSTGGVPMVTRYTKEKLHSRGIGGSSAVVGGIIRGITGSGGDVLQPTEIALDVDAQHIKGLHLGTIVTTLPSLLLGLDPFWGEGNGPLRISYVKAAPRRLPAHLLGLWMGRKSKDRSADGLQSWTAQSLTYDYDGPVMLDGETLALENRFCVHATQPLDFVT